MRSRLSAKEEDDSHLSDRVSFGLPGRWLREPPFLSSHTFKRSVQEAGCNDVVVNTIMRFLADNLGAAEARIRANVKTIDKKDGFNWPSASDETAPVESPSSVAEPDSGASPPN